MRAGYTLIELVVVMAIFAVVMTITAISFSRIVSSSGQITRNADSNVEGMIGLELLRTDLENAGFGLPWSYPAAVHIAEAADQAAVPGLDGTTLSLYNDLEAPPRAVVCGDNVGFNGSDYLVLKGSALAMSRTSRRWSYLTYSSVRAVPKPWRTDSDLALGSSEYVVVLKAGAERGELSRKLVASGPDKFFARFKMDSSTDALSAAFFPAQPTDKHLVYGIDPDTAPRMPYNRADYYLKRPESGTDLASRCAPKTANLYKGVISQANGKLAPPYPILECVADMQVVFTTDGGSGPVRMNPQAAALKTAEEVRDLVREIRVYILAHEGKRDASFSYVPDASEQDAECAGRDAVRVGEPPEPGGEHGWGSCFRLSSLGSGWQHYRWKLYRLVVQTKNIE